MNIDWASCPEATHFDPVDQNFLREIDRALLLFNRNNGWYVPVHTQYGTTIEDCGRPLLKRPEWRGEGLPPVGTVCEYNNFEPHPVSVDLKWSPVRIVAHDEQGGDVFAVFSSLSGYHGTRKVECFRPIRTAEQIAAEERESHINGMLCHYALGGTRRGLAEALYDAGYRKQVQP